MAIQYKHLGLVREVINTLSSKKVPFALTLTKNAKVVDDLISGYNQKKMELVDKYAILDESGGYLGVFVDGSRVNNPQKFSDIEMSDVSSFNSDIESLNSTTIDINMFKIDTNKDYFDSNLNKVVKVSDFLESGVDVQVIGMLVGFGMLEV